jgi:triacylglycerol lipase
MRRTLGIPLVARLATIVALAVAATGVAVVAAPVAARAAAHTPVVFVHGYVGSASNWITAKAVFRAAGYTDAELFTYDYNYNQSNETSARGLATFVGQVRSRTGAAKVDIVNHSMGGLVSRWYLKQLGGTGSVAHWASLAGANHGTTWATACVVFPSCQEMLPGSSFVNRLNSGDESPGSVRYATWYSPCDGIIIPYTSTRVDGATNTFVPCLVHLAFLTDTGVLGQARAFLAS